jgi:hypothetical protein
MSNLIEQLAKLRASIPATMPKADSSPVSKLETSNPAISKIVELRQSIQQEEKFVLPGFSNAPAQNLRHRSGKHAAQSVECEARATYGEFLKAFAQSYLDNQLEVMRQASTMIQSGQADKVQAYLDSQAKKQNEVFSGLFASRQLWIQAKSEVQKYTDKEEAWNESAGTGERKRGRPAKNRMLELD